MMQKIARPTAALALIAACAAVPAFAQNVAVVNGTPIPTERVDALAKQLALQGQQDTPELRQKIGDELINREVLAQEAARKGILNQSDVKLQIALAEQGVVVRALQQEYLRDNQPTDAELHARYDEIVKQIGGKEYHLHHILVDNEKQAQELIAKLKKGAKFEDLAKQYSKDVGSARNGGDLDWATPKTYVPEFADAAVKLKKGQFTDTPVHTQFGWHIIRLDDTRDLKIPPFDDVKPQLAQQAEQEKWLQYAHDLRAKAKIQ